jgi:hypothetical protein
MFGFAAFAARFAVLVDSFGTQDGASARGRYTSVQAKLVEAFADLEYLRLIFAPLESGRRQ